MIDFVSLQHLRKLKIALERGYAPRVLDTAPDILDIVKMALWLHERNIRETELLGKALAGLCDKLGPETKEKNSNWCLKPGVAAMELLDNLVVVTYAINEVRRD